MLIDFEQTMKTLNGEEIKESEKKDSVPLTLKSVCINALLSEIDREKTSGEDKVERYELAKKIHEGGTIELKTEQVVLIKERIGKFYLPLLVGGAFEMLEGQKDE